MSSRLFARFAVGASIAVFILGMATYPVQAGDPQGMPTASVKETVMKSSSASPKPALTIIGNDGKTMEHIIPAAGNEAQAKTTPSAGGLPGKVTVAEAVTIGVATNPEYTRNANNRRATDEELRQAEGLYLPSVDLSADMGSEYSDNVSTRGGLDGDNTETKFRRQASLTLTQLLFDGFETKYENKRQQARVLSASHRVREASELVGLSIVESYLDVLRQRELLQIARQNVADHLSIMERIEDSSSAGRSTEADNEQAKARLASARANEASIREALRIAEAAFIRDVGDQPQDLVMPLVPADKLDATVEEAVKTSLHQSPTLDISEADIQVAHNEFEGSKSRFYPKVNLQLNAREGHDLSGIAGRDRSVSSLVVANWNLYRGGIDTANVREQINREAQAKEERAKSARQVENEVRSTWARMVSAGERAREFSAQAAANTETVKAYKDQFDLNRRTLLDVLDSQNELFVSQSNVVNAEFVEIFAVYRLLAMKGELLPTLGVAYPRESDPAKM